MEQELRRATEGRRRRRRVTWPRHGTKPRRLRASEDRRRRAGEGSSGWRPNWPAARRRSRLLLDELSRVEEAQAAGRAEWEQLAGWVAELEQRVEGQDGDALLRLQERLAAQQQQAEELRKKSEQDRRAGRPSGGSIEGEIARLQAELAQVGTAPGLLEATTAEPLRAPSRLRVVEALRSENLRLRAAWQELVEADSPPSVRSPGREAGRDA